MRLSEIFTEDDDDVDINHNDERISAISQLLIDKTDEANTEATLNTEAFINIIQKMGIPITSTTLMDMVQQGDLQNIIKTVNADEVIFKGQEDASLTSSMTVDKAKDVVSAMGKKAAKSRAM